MERTGRTFAVESNGEALREERRVEVSVQDLSAADEIESKKALTPLQARSYSPSFKTTQGVDLPSRVASSHVHQFEFSSDRRDHLKVVRTTTEFCQRLKIATSGSNP